MQPSFYPFPRNAKRDDASQRLVGEITPVVSAGAAILRFDRESCRLRRMNSRRRIMTTNFPDPAA